MQAAREDEDTVIDRPLVHGVDGGHDLRHLVRSPAACVRLVVDGDEVLGQDCLLGLMNGPDDRSHPYHARERRVSTIPCRKLCGERTGEGCRRSSIRCVADLEPAVRGGSNTSPPELTLAGWRRAVAELYAEVRRCADPRRGHALWREGRDRLFRDHPDSPLAAGDPLRRSGLPYWPYDPRWRLAVPIVPAADPATHVIATAATELTRIRQIGWAELPQPIGGRLAVWWFEQYGGGVFLPFRDATAGSSTYGAGRYLLDAAKGADLGQEGDRTVLDFNFSYHPSCRYDPVWQCPLAPPENHVSVKVDAGERLP